MTFAEALAELIAQYKEYTADAVVEALYEHIGGESNGGFDWECLALEFGVARDVLDDLATAKRCICSPHRGPQEALIFVERAESTIANLRDGGGC